MQAPQKKSMDVVDVHSIAMLSSSALAGCVIDNVYHAGYYWYLKLRCSNPSYASLKLEPGVRFHISRVEPAEKRVDKVAMFLRSHVRGGKIVNVKQIGWERAAEIVVVNREKEYRLVIETLPRGFLVVANKEGKILFSDRQAELRDRAIKVGSVYRPPPQRGLPPHSEELIERLKSSKTVLRGIVEEWGLPGYVAEELLYRAGILGLKGSSPGNLRQSDLEALAMEYKKLVEEAGRGTGYLVIQQGTPVLFTTYRPRLFEEEHKLVVKASGLFEVVDAFFLFYERLRKETAEKEAVEKKRKEIEAALASISDMVEKYKKELEEQKRLLELVYSSYELIEAALNCAKRTREELGWELITSKCANVAWTDKHRGAVGITVGGREIVLDIRQSLKEFIIQLAKKAGELEKKIEAAEAKKQELLEKVESLPAIPEERTAVARPREWYEKYHWLITKNGFLAIGGKNAEQNEALVKKHLGPDDVFLHADIHGAPAVVLITGGKEPTLEDIEQAAYLSACYSKAWKAGFSYVEVFWVRGHQVSKRPPSGEYLPKGSFMVYGQRNYLKIPLSLALGVEKVESDLYGTYYRVIAGPERLIAERSISYVVLSPSDEPPEVVARKIAESAVPPEAQGFITLKEIIERLPGPSALVKIVPRQTRLG